MAERKPMSVEKRAKQFMPFAALKGYEDALRAMEKIKVDKISLTEERKEELDRILHVLQRNDMVEVVYFRDEEYIRMRGRIARLDLDARILKVVNTKISFEDIYRLEKEE